MDLTASVIMAEIFAMVRVDVVRRICSTTQQSVRFNTALNAQCWWFNVHCG